MKIGIILLLGLISSHLLLAQIHPRIKRVSERVTLFAKNDYEKARKIHIWIARHIRYDGKITGQSPIRTLNRRKGVCSDMADLFVEMCKSLNVNAVAVNGYAKGSGYLPGVPFYWDDHKWAAFEAAGEWHLSDPTWDSSPTFWRRLSYRIFFGIKMRKPVEWFDVLPDTMKLSHFPVYQGWQLSYFLERIKDFEHDTIPPILADSSIICDYPKEIEQWIRTDARGQLLLEVEDGVKENPRNHKIVMENYGEYGHSILREEIFEDKVFRKKNNGTYKVRWKYRRKPRVIKAMIKSRPDEVKKCLFYLDSAYKASLLTLQDAKTEYRFKRQHWGKRHQFVMQAEGKRSKLRQHLSVDRKNQLKAIRREIGAGTGKKQKINGIYRREILRNSWKLPKKAKANPANFQRIQLQIDKNHQTIQALLIQQRKQIDSLQKLERELWEQKIWSSCYIDSIIDSSTGDYSFYVARKQEEIVEPFQEEIDSLLKSYKIVFKQLKKAYSTENQFFQKCYGLSSINKSLHLQAAKCSPNHEAIKAEYEAEILQGEVDLNFWLDALKRREAALKELRKVIRLLKRSIRHFKRKTWGRIWTEKLISWQSKRYWRRYDYLFRYHIGLWAKTTGRSSKWLKRVQKAIDKEAKRMK
ncbi:MAG: transglutaminase domain-containing protein [Bacteroidia bacterium]